MEFQTTVHASVPLDGNVEQNLPLREPSEVRHVDRHLAVVKQLQVGVGNRNPKVPKLLGNDVQVRVAEALHLGDARPDWERT